MMMVFFQIFMMTMTTVDVFQDKNLTWNGIESPGDKNSKKRDFPLESTSLQLVTKTAVSGKRLLETWSIKRQDCVKY